MGKLVLFYQLKLLFRQNYCLHLICTHDLHVVNLRFMTHLQEQAIYILSSMKLSFDL